MEKDEHIKAVKKVWYIYSVCGLAVLAAAVFIPADILLQHTPSCYSVRALGKECFLCGSTRSFIQSASGNFTAAMRLNKLAVVLFIAAIINSAIFMYYLINGNFKIKRIKL